MSNLADLAVFIGRFQPFHLGHLYAVGQALTAAKNVQILIGDTGGPRTIKNPWTFEERAQMIRASLPEDLLKRVTIDRVYDHPSDTEWMAQVQVIVGDAINYAGLNPKKVLLVGHDKDSTSFYLKLFPQWKRFDTGYESLPVNATDIRSFIFEKKPSYAAALCPPGTIKVIQEIPQVIVDDLIFEYEAIKKYRASWANAPFPPVFVTTDCVVIQSGHILLVQRGERPGKGLWAMPGGFIDQTETIEDCAIRELIEETQIHLQPEVLRRCITEVFVEDRAGGVSQEDRGRIITHVHIIRLDDSKPLPKVKGGDDAAKAEWVPIGDLDFRQIFSDHGKIIVKALGMVK